MNELMNITETGSVTLANKLNNIFFDYVRFNIMCFSFFFIKIIIIEGKNKYDLSSHVAFLFLVF